MALHLSNVKSSIYSASGTITSSFGSAAFSNWLFRYMYYPEFGIKLASSILLYKKTSLVGGRSPNPPRTVLRTSCAPEESGTFYGHCFAVKRADSSLMTATSH